MRILSLFLAVLLCLVMTACQPVDTVTEESNDADKLPSEDIYQPLLYKVTDEDGSSVWLFGSIHVGDESMSPFPSYVTRAFEEADALAVECDLLNESNTELATKLLAYMGNSMYKDGSTIQDHVDPKAYEDAKRLLELHNLYSSIYEHYGPIVWWFLLQEVSTLQAGYNAEYGVDMQLLTEAYRVDKPIIEIESAEEQYELLFGFSIELQTMLFEETANGLANPFSSLGMISLIKAWKRGDADWLVSMLNAEDDTLPEEDMALYEEYDRMMVGDRNLRMTDFAEDMLETDQEVFICVGAAHVVGDDAMVDLLEERGYTVEIVQ